MASQRCRRCGTEAPDGARFCANCGAALHPGSSRHDERRVVTILFADLVGYTTLAEHLDPERTKRLVSDCFDRLAADIATFGGRVDKVVGDAIIGLFGAPVAHEDDVERAVRAALVMQRTLDALADETSAGEHRMEMRIGINTGEVLVGSIVGSDYTAMGDVVNIAARLQTMAPPGAILIGAATEALCPPSIQLHEFGESMLKGRQRPERAWLVVGASPTGGRAARADVPFVGRRLELGLLHGVVELAHAGHTAVVALSGEAGSGKTRIVEELLSRIGPATNLAVGAGSPYGDSTPWAPLRAAVSTLLAIDPEVDGDSLRDSVRSRLTPLCGDRRALGIDRAVDVVAHVFGEPSPLDDADPAGVRDEIIATFVELVRASARSELTVVWIDNLQWVDAFVLEALAVLVRSGPDLPVVVITGHRSGEDVAWPPVLERLQVVRLALGPLSADESTDLVESIVLEAADVPGRSATAAPAGASPAGSEEAEQVALVVERGGGNPLYLIELAELARRGLPDAELPGSLRALIAARLDQLPPEERLVIENAALLGNSGTRVSLREFGNALGQGYDEATLTNLVDAGWLDMDGGRWTFRSDVVREVAYRTLTKQTRAKRHAGVAMHLQADRRAHLDDIAAHQARAAELTAELGRVEGVPDDMADTAAATLARAATEAIVTGRFVHAARLASRALALDPSDRALAGRLLLSRGVALIEQRQFSEARADLDRAVDQAVADGDLRLEGEARHHLGTIEYSQGHLDAGRAELDRSIVLLTEAGDQLGRAAATRERGLAEVFGGSLDEARRHLGTARQMYSVVDDERGRAWTQQNLAWVEFQAGHFETALTELAESKERFTALGDRSGVTWAEGLQAYVLYFQRHADDAAALADHVMAASQQWGDSWALLMMQTLLANIRLWSGHPDEALDIGERALAGFRASADPYGIMLTLAPLIRARVAVGAGDELRAAMDELIALDQQFGELGLALQAAAGAAMHAGDGELGARLANGVVERNLSTGASPVEAMVLLALTSMQQGDPGRALELVADDRLRSSPFGTAATALVEARHGDTARARRLASGVDDEHSASYFDRALAHLAGVLAAWRDGHHDDARRWLARLSAHAAAVGDVVFEAIAARLVAAVSTTGERGVELPPLGEGWRRVIADVVADSAG